MLRKAHVEDGDPSALTEVVQELAERVYDALEVQTGAAARHALRRRQPVRRAG
jgi:hypothetical protein